MASAKSSKYYSYPGYADNRGLIPPFYIKLLSTIHYTRLLFWNHSLFPYFTYSPNFPRRSLSDYVRVSLSPGTTTHIACLFFPNHHLSFWIHTIRCASNRARAVFSS